MAGLFLTVRPELAAHLARALAEHLRWLRRSGLPVPPELAELLATMTALSGPERPNVARPDGAGEPAAVSYEVAAQRLGVSARTVRRMVSDGRLPATRVGRRVLVPVAALAAMTEGTR